MRTLFNSFLHTFVASLFRIEHERRTHINLHPERCIEYAVATKSSQTTQRNPFIFSDIYLSSKEFAYVLI